MTIEHANIQAQTEFAAVFDSKSNGGRIQGQVFHLLTAIYYKLSAIEQRLAARTEPWPPHVGDDGLRARRVGTP